MSGPQMFRKLLLHSSKLSKSAIFWLGFQQFPLLHAHSSLDVEPTFMPAALWGCNAHYNKKSTLINSTVVKTFHSEPQTR